MEDDDANREEDDDLDEELTNFYNRTFTDSFIDSLKSSPLPANHNLTRIQPIVKRLPVEPCGEPTNQLLEFDWDLDPAEDKWHKKKKKKKKHHHHKKKKVSSWIRLLRENLDFQSFSIDSLLNFKHIHHHWHWKSKKKCEHHHWHKVPGSIFNAEIRVYASVAFPFRCTAVDG